MVYEYIMNTAKTPYIRIIYIYSKSNSQCIRNTSSVDCTQNDLYNLEQYDHYTIWQDY